MVSCQCSQIYFSTALRVRLIGIAKINKALLKNLSIHTFTTGGTTYMRPKPSYAFSNRKAIFKVIIALICCVNTCCVNRPKRSIRWTLLCFVDTNRKALRKTTGVQRIRSQNQRASERNRNCLTDDVLIVTPVGTVGPHCKKQS